MQEEGELENLFNNSHEQAMEMRAQEDCKTGTNRSCKPVFFVKTNCGKTRFANRFSDRFRTGLKTGSTIFLRMRTNKNDEKPFRFLQTDLQLRLVHLSKRQST